MSSGPIMQSQESNSLVKAAQLQDDTSTNANSAPAGSSPSAAATPSDAGASCTFNIAYEQVPNTFCPNQNGDLVPVVAPDQCPAGLCGKTMAVRPTGICGVGSGCPPLAGLDLTESVTSDHGCTGSGGGTPVTGSGCTIQPAPGQPSTCGKFGIGCMDHFCLCMDPSIVPDVGCTETVNQRIGVGGMLAESHTISFNIVKGGTSGCGGIILRS
jgi:hypothetical protein